jgi:hypothetical protein
MSFFDPIFLRTVSLANQFKTIPIAFQTFSLEKQNSLLDELFHGILSVKQVKTEG